MVESDFVTVKNNNLVESLVECFIDQFSIRQSTDSGQGSGQGCSEDACMKTTVDIPEKELKDLLSFTRAKTKKEAITRAVTEFNHKNRMRKLNSLLGTFEDFITNEELREARGE